MPSKSTYLSATALLALLLTQALAGDLIAAGLAIIALGSGTFGYAKDKSVIGKLLKKL